MANIHEHAVLTDELVPTGSGYLGKEHKDFMHANNEQWIGFSMEIGPAGNVYVLDWHDAFICGIIFSTRILVVFSAWPPIRV